jgi:hypothetical protein
VRITLDPPEAGNPPLTLRHKYGSGFLENDGSDVQSHARQYELFMALSDTIEKSYADDIRDYVADVRDTSRFDAA